jgi:MFS family permease
VAKNTFSAGLPVRITARLWTWFDRHIFDLLRQMRISYLPPLMVYMAAGISGLTGIVGTFFIKDYLDLPAEFLAMLGFWAGLPWALKMPLGHLVDLIWRFKSVLVFVGATLIGASLAIMLGLISSPSLLTPHMTVESWFVLAALLAPVGYVIQDVVADAMTVEAVPVVDEDGKPYDEKTLKLMHTTMQTLGRVAIVGGGIVVSLMNILLFNDVGRMNEHEQVLVYITIYKMAMIIPLISVAGVILAEMLKRCRSKNISRLNCNEKYQPERTGGSLRRVDPNWWILGGSSIFVLFTLAMGLMQVPYNQEIVFAGSMTIVLFLMANLVKVLEPSARRTLVGTAVVIFVFRALPGPGAGASWWQIDELGFDQQFISLLSLIGSSLALFGMFIFRRFMAEKSILFVVGFLTILGTLLSLPVIGMFYGFHEWTARLTNGVVDAHFIAVVDTALESPLGQVAMIPMLAWIAASAPAHLKATFFAVMASFTNLALSLSNLGTKYLNQIFTINREVLDPLTGQIRTPADYSELGILLLTVTALGLLLPMTAIVLINRSRLTSREHEPILKFPRATHR